MQRDGIGHAKTAFLCKQKILDSPYSILFVCNIQTLYGTKLLQIKLLVILNTDNSKYPVISKSMGTFSFCLYISTPDMSNYWYSK